MRRSEHSTRELRPGARSVALARSRRLVLPAAAAGASLAFALAGLALAHGPSGSSFNVGSARNATAAETIIVDRGGRSVYRLSPETAHHLLCRGGCLQVWRPLTVSSRHAKLRAAPGIQGHLGLLSRGHHSFQLTLRGLPLYTYVGDGARGQVTGRNIHSFGGVWFLVSARATQASPQAPPPAPAPAAPPASTPPLYAPY